MGCDIHLWTETKTDNGWVCDQASHFSIEDTDTDQPYPDMLQAYSNRYYGLFGLLSEGVRVGWDGYAFGQRSNPEDASSEYKQISDNWDCDGHSHSWLTIKEIKEKIMELTVAPYVQAPHGVTALNDLLQGISEHITPTAEQRIVFFFDN